MSMIVLYKNIGECIRSLSAWNKHKNIGINFVHNKSKITRTKCYG